MRSAREGMRSRAARLALLAGVVIALAFSACTLNPQPIPPGARGSDAGGAASYAPNDNKGTDGASNEQGSEDAGTQPIPNLDAGDVPDGTGLFDDGGDAATDASVDASADAPDDAPNDGAAD